jgi:hypothetical protein
VYEIDQTQKVTIQNLFILKHKTSAKNVQMHFFPNGLDINVLLAEIIRYTCDTQPQI